jgi:hypothetical protein
MSSCVSVKAPALCHWMLVKLLTCAPACTHANFVLSVASIITVVDQSGRSSVSAPAIPAFVISVKVFFQTTLEFETSANIIKSVLDGVVVVY